MSRVIKRTVSVTVNDTTWTFRRIAAQEQAQIAFDLSKKEIEAREEFKDNEALAEVAIMKSSVDFIMPFLQDRLESVSPKFVEEDGTPIPVRDSFLCLDSFQEIFKIYTEFMASHALKPEEKKES